jgi:hypothetical protein
MIAFTLLMLLVLMPQQSPANQISDAQKQHFIKLLKTLPHKAEFFTDDAIKTAGPYLPVLFSLTDKDIEGYDIYPFGALSRGLCDIKEHRQYATAHFGEIRNSELKLFWARRFSREPSPEITRLQDALKSGRKRSYSKSPGPTSQTLKTRVTAARGN